VKRESAISIYATQGWVLRATFPTNREGKLEFSGPLFAFSEQTDEKSDLFRISVYDHELSKVLELPRARPHSDGDLLVRSPDGQSLLVVVDDDTRTPTSDASLARVELWSFLPPKKLLTFSVPENEYVTYLSFDKQGNVLVGAGEKLTLLSSSGRALAVWDYRGDLPPAFSHDGNALVFRHDQWAELWSSSVRRLRTLRDKDCDGQGLLWSPDDKTVVLGGFSYNLCLFDAKTGRFKGTLPDPRIKAKTFEDEGMIEPVEFSSDGRVLVARDSYGLFAFDVKRGRRYDPQKALSPEVNPWTQTDTRIVHRARDDALLVLDRGHVQARFEAGRLVAEDLAADAMRQLSVSSDGEMFLRFANRLEVVETKPGGRVVELEGSEVDKDAFSDQELVFAPGNGFVMSALFGPLRIWSTATGKRVGPKRDERCSPK
jgi:WD40 repeat protein